MISIDAAGALIEEHVCDIGVERVSVAAAHGRILRQTVVAERDQPPFDRVTMDGIAFRWEAGRSAFPCHQQVFAGQPQVHLETGTSVEIMTGAVLPIGADTVVPIENVEISDGEALLTGSAKTGQFVHRRASDHERGSELLRPGTRLDGPEIAILASAGLVEVDVARARRVIVISTGDELVPAGSPIAAHQVRLSNGPALAAMCQNMGATHVDLLHLSDEREKLRSALATALAHNDTLILSGGVSMGKADHVPALLAELGCAKVFHRVAQRPGKPLWFGLGPKEQAIFALPGNPVSALSCMRRHVLPGLAAASGYRCLTPISLPLAEDVEFRPALTGLLPAKLTNHGQFSAVSPQSTNTSGDFAALGDTQGLIELPADRQKFQAGEAVAYYPWAQL